MTRCRRGFLGGVAGMAALAGCAGGGSSETSFAKHPASAGVGGQPTLGATPGEGEGTIIAFEDPSCPTCARFETDTFPRLKSELLDTERASFVFRGIPIIYEWGKPATMALEATYDRSGSAFWALKNHYYTAQDGFDTDNVRSKTESFLDENTDVDATGVVDDAEAQASQDAVDADLAVADELGVNGTPTFYVFDSGTFSTDITGAIGYDSLKGAMGI
ncbi:MAG: thioredoxin domain-containing protein [Halolamina sp.]|uniref:DsbA family protein n=1 Tax=Halolamina sp. TaxID=1940283 RepID=UPI002FC31CFA